MRTRKGPLLVLTLTVLFGALALPAAAAAPGLVPSSSVLSYGRSTVGSTALRTITFTNRSSSPVLLGPVAVSWRGPAGFSLHRDTCGSEIVQLTAGASCEYEIAFSPATTGTFRARLLYNANGRTAAIELRGRAG